MRQKPMIYNHADAKKAMRILDSFLNGFGTRYNNPKRTYRQYVWRYLFTQAAQEQKQRAMFYLRSEGLPFGSTKDSSIYVNVPKSFALDWRII